MDSPNREGTEEPATSSEVSSPPAVRAPNGPKVKIRRKRDVTDLRRVVLTNMARKQDPLPNSVHMKSESPASGHKAVDQTAQIGHGSFLTCLEAMYYKLMACELKYTAVLGKPTEVSYLHATHCLQNMANDLGHNPPKTVYVIGDNPLSDVLGSNLYNRYLQHGGKGSPPAPVPLRPLYDSPQTLNIAEMERRQDADVLPSSGTSSGIGNVAGATPPLLAASQSTSPGPLTSVTSQRGFSDLAQARFDHVNLDVLEDGSTAPHRTRENVEECLSVLVETGVYREGCHLNGTVLPINKLILELSVKEREMLEKPDFVEKDLFSAVRMILNRERWR